MMEEQLTTTQIAARIGISERTVQRWIAQGKLKAQGLAHHRYLVNVSDLEALTLPQLGRPQQDELVALRTEFYNLAHQVSELERIMEEIVASLTTLPEQIEQARLTVPLQMENAPSSMQQAEARLAELERRVSELERREGQ